jgi:hypothetical protein
MKKLLCTVALVGMLGAPAIVSAQATVGPLAAFHDDFDFGIGGFASIPVPSLDPNLSIVPSFVYFFPGDPLGFFEINGDVMYQFEVSDETPVLPFAFAGLNVARYSVDIDGLGSGSNTEIGLNLGGGIKFRAESLEPFAGAKFEIQDGSGFVIFGGVGFQVGG